MDVKFLATKPDIQDFIHEIGIIKIMEREEAVRRNKIWARWLDNNVNS